MLDSTYLLIVLIPGLMIATYTSFRVRYCFTKFSTVISSSRLTGSQAAIKMLHYSGIYDVEVERVDGFLSDHYDTNKRVLRLSSDVFDKMSISAICVACHEAGHAIQHANSYSPLVIRNVLVPVVSSVSYISYFVILIGLFIMSQEVMYIGIALFCFVILFALITLPIEYDASMRAKKIMYEAGIVHSIEEVNMSSKVLNAAYMTYVAAVINTLLVLIYYIIRAKNMLSRR